MIDTVQRDLSQYTELRLKLKNNENNWGKLSNRVNMDDKEQADRMAAAEAMSSLSSMILIREIPADEKTGKSKSGTKNRDEKSKQRKKDPGHSKDVGGANENGHTSASPNGGKNINMNCNVPTIIETQIDLTPTSPTPSKSEATSSANNSLPVNLITATALSKPIPPRIGSSQAPNQVISFVPQTNQWVCRQNLVKPHIPVVPIPRGPTLATHSNTFDISKLKERLLTSGAHRGNTVTSDAPAPKKRPVPVSLVINQSLIKSNRPSEPQSVLRMPKGNKAVRKTTTNNVKGAKPFILPVSENKSPLSSLLPSDSLIENVAAISPTLNGTEADEKTIPSKVVTSSSSQLSSEKKKSDSKLPLKKRRVNYENDDSNSRSFLSNMSRLHVDNHSSSPEMVDQSTSTRSPEHHKDDENGNNSSISQSQSANRNNVLASQSSMSAQSSSNVSHGGSSHVTNTNSTNPNILAQVVAIAAGVGTPSIKVDPQTSLKFLSEIHAALTPDEDGDLPLHIAVVQEHLPLVHKFVQLMSISKKSVDRYNKDQQTPLHLAVKLNFVSGVRILLAAGANVNLVDRSGSSSIHIAVKENLMECLNVLIRESKHPVELNNKDFEGMAPLHTAVINNNIGIASLLLSRNIDVDNMDGKSGRTPIYHAAEKKLCEMVYLLIKKGANPDIANYAGVTAIAAAQSRSLAEIAAIMSRGLSDIINRNAIPEGKDTKELLSNYLAEKADKSPPDDDAKSNDSVMITENVSDPGSPSEPMDLSSSSTENLIPKPAVSPNFSEDYTNR